MPTTYLGKKVDSVENSVICVIKEVPLAAWCNFSFIATTNQMRLNPFETESIRKAFRQHFHQDDHLWLFGSRVDPAKRGGDIDLYVETQLSVDQAVKAKANFVVAMWNTIGEQKIDVVLNVLVLKHHLPIYDIAKKQGIILV
jgi:uncharacterized protein